MVAVAAVAAGLTWVLVRDTSSKSELFAEATTTVGPDPFTASSAVGAAMVIPTTLPIAVPTTAAGTVAKVSGATSGLYGGTLDNSSCDPEKQITFLQADAGKANAFAGVLGIKVADIPSYLRALTPVLLTVDTRVTNHGYVGGHATSRQSVLQAGTAVLVDQYGMPRVRCYCGNPLTAAEPLSGDVTTTGQQWPGYDTDRFVTVAASTVVIKIFILIDVSTGTQFQRPAGTSGDDDSATTATGTCAKQPDDAMHDLLANRKSGDRTAMSKCASTTVVDYLFALSDGFASSLTASACRPPAELGLSPSAAATACALSNNAIVLFDLKDSNSGFYASGVVLVDGPPPSSSGTPSTSPSSSPPAACGSGAPAFQPTRPAERVLVSYFKAMNDKDYATAFSYLSDELQHGWIAFGPTADALANYTKFYGDHVRCVVVTSIKTAVSTDPTVSASMGIQWYEVQFDDEYISPFPAGSGKLQGYYRVRADPHEGAGRPPDRITGEATGL